MITVSDAHASDINVASWNALQPATLLTGADDGCIRVWDLRMVHQRYGPKRGSSAADNSISAFTHSFDVSGSLYYLNIF